jgi:hypothetical protein
VLRSPHTFRGRSLRFNSIRPIYADMSTTRCFEHTLPMSASLQTLLRLHLVFLFLVVHRNRAQGLRRRFFQQSCPPLEICLKSDYAPPRLSSVSRRTRRLYAFLSCMNNSAASGFAGLPQLGSVNRDWIDVKTELTVYDGLHLFWMMSRHSVPSW